MTAAEDSFSYFYTVQDDNGARVRLHVTETPRPGAKAWIDYELETGEPVERHPEGGFVVLTTGQRLAVINL